MKVLFAALLLFAMALSFCTPLPVTGAVRKAPSVAPQLVLQVGHEGTVKTAAFAPDGKHIATGGSDGMVRLWDAQSGSLLAAWPTHKGVVSFLQFAPQGGLLASAGYDGNVVLRTMMGAVRFTLSAYGPIGFSPDGATLVAGMPNKKFPGAYRQPALWSTTTGQQKLAFEINSFDAVAFSPDGAVLATSLSHIIHLWDTRTGKPLRYFGAQPIYTVRTLAFSSDGKTLACGGDIVRLFEVATGEPLRNLTANLGNVRLVTFLPNDRLLTVADDAARLWNGQTFERERTIRPPQTGFGVLARSHDGKSLLCAGGGLRFLNLITGHWRSLPQLSAQRNELHNLYFSPDGKTLALTVGGGAGESEHSEIWLWKPGSIQPTRVLAMEEDIFHAVPLSGGKTLLCEANFALTRYDLTSGAHRSFGDWENGVSLVAVSPNGALVAGAYFTRPLRLYDARSGKYLRTIQTIKDAESEQEEWSWLTFSPDGKTLATASGDGSLRLWNTANGRLQKQWQLRDSPGEIVFSPDGRFMAAAGESGAVWLWPSLDSKNAPRALNGHRGRVHCLAISPDGRALVSGGEDGTVRVWSAASGEFVRLLRPNSGEIHAVRFTPRGILLCATQNGQVQAWDALTGRLRVIWRPLPGKMNWVAWTPDGFYDAPPGAAPFLRWRQGDKWLSKLPQRRRPAIVAAAWGF